MSTDENVRGLQEQWAQGRLRRFLIVFSFAVAGFFAFAVAMLLWLLVPPLLRAVWTGEWSTLGLYAVGAAVIAVLVTVQMAGEAVLDFVFRPIVNLLRRSRTVVYGSTIVTAAIGVVLLVFIVGSVVLMATA